MEIKKIFENISNFIIKRFIELFGILISISAILLFISLLSYSPEDPNFIFPENAHNSHEIFLEALKVPCFHKSVEYSEVTLTV